MKPLQTIKTVTRKSCRKLRFYEFRSVESSFRSNRNRALIEISRDSRIDFLTISIDRAKVSTDRKSLFSNFTQKISELEFSLYETIFSKLKHHYYNLTMYIPIYTTNSLFLYNSIIVTHITTFPIILFLFQINKENLYFICSYVFPYSIIQNNCFSIILF